MTNNFSLYKEYITPGFDNDVFPENDTYYVVELIRRGKDHPSLPAANLHFKNYYIRTPEHLDRYKDEIIQLCDMFKMRAYASVNYKSFYHVSLAAMHELTKRIYNNDFRKNYNIFESCSGSYNHPKNKCWVVDLDDCELNDDTVKYCIDVINKVKPNDTQKVITQFPTKSGVHLITTPFDRKEFETIYKSQNFEEEFYHNLPDIKKNHLTLLYENL